jgi:AbrB family looped-hinge helix DNA binding protein
MKITTKGQVTIPQALRERFGLLAHTEVEFRPLRDGVKVVKAAQRGLRGARLVAHLAGRGDGGMTTDQIMSLTRGEE